MNTLKSILCGAVILTPVTLIILYSEGFEDGVPEWLIVLALVGGLLSILYHLGEIARDVDRRLLGLIESKPARQHKPDTLEG